MKKIALHWQILIALVLAVLYGIFLPNQVDYVHWMGIIFMRALKMIVVPLVFTSLVTGVTNIGSGKNLGYLGLKTLGYYITTSLLAILTGLFFVNIIKPGVGVNITLPTSSDKIHLADKSITETLIEIIPKNIFNALTQNNMMLSIIFFAILFGFFIIQVKKEQQELLTNLFQAGFDVMMKITLFIIKFAPLGIFGYVSKIIAEQNNLPELITSLGWFMLTVVLGLFVHGAISLPVILHFFARINPAKHIRAMVTPLLTAFSTASSNATLPLTMEAVEENDGVSNKISSFTLPLGATINMDGTALYELAVAGFVAQIYGIDLTITQQLIVVFTALLSSIGTAGIPMASLVTMTIIFSAVGLPLEGIALILPVDRPLDMLRTATNVWSDSCGAVIIAKSEGEKLKV